MNLLEMNSPFTLYSPATVDLAIPGQVATLNQTAMRNPTSNPILVDEVRFSLADPVADGITLQWFAGFILARLRVQRTWITSDFMPLWLLSENFNNFILPFSGSVTAPEVPTNSFVYVYRPPKPIIVPAGSTLQLELMVDPNGAILMPRGGSTPCAMMISYACRTVSDDDSNMPTVDVPYAARWLPPLLPAGQLSQGASFRSGQSDLAASFAEPLHVSAMTGRILVPYNGSTSTAGDSQIVYPTIPDNLVTLKIWNANGAIVVRNATPFSQLFSSIDRMFRMNTTMDSKSYFLAAIRADLRSITGTPDAEFNYAAAHIGLHGWRTMEWASYMN